MTKLRDRNSLNWQMRHVCVLPNGEIATLKKLGRTHTSMVGRWELWLGSKKVLDDVSISDAKQWVFEYVLRKTNQPILTIQFEPAECDVGCTQPDCHYVHKNLWMVYDDNKNFVDSFTTEEEAKKFIERRQNDD